MAAACNREEAPGPEIPFLEIDTKKGSAVQRSEYKEFQYSIVSNYKNLEIT